MMVVYGVSCLHLNLLTDPKAHAIALRTDHELASIYVKNDIAKMRMIELSVHFYYLVYILFGGRWETNFALIIN